MPLIDLPLDALRSYQPDLARPAGLDEFWQRTLDEARHHSLDAAFTAVDTGLAAVETFDVTYRGFGGETIRGWLHLPAAGVRGDQPLPGIVQFQGYNGGRGLAHEHLFWAVAGYAHLVMDTRGQGSGWTVGDTPDSAGTGPSQPGFMTRGIERPDDYFYRRVYTDAVRAVEALRGHPLVDPARVAVTGGSQGGGISIAVAALEPAVAAVMPDVPFLCDFRRAAQITARDPYTEIARYLKMHRDGVDRAFATLSYFDGAVLGAQATAPALFSVALMDETCPPSTVFAAYNAYAGPKDIVVYEFNDHEGGQSFQQERQMAWLRQML